MTKAIFIYSFLFLAPAFFTHAYAASCPKGATALCAKVDRAYRNVLGRAADQGGKSYWVAQLKKGVSEARMIASFKSSPEYKNKVAKEKAAKNNSAAAQKARVAKVERAYWNILGRAPDKAGKAYWLNQLKKGATEGQMIAAFKNSAEYRNKLAQGKSKGKKSPTEAKPKPQPKTPSPSRVCSAEKIREVLTPGNPSEIVIVDCDLNLKKSDVVQRRLRLRGKSASGLTLDCHGASLGLPGNAERMLEVNSRKKTDEAGNVTWDRPEGVTIRNCVVNGQARVYGMAGSYALPSSRQSGHTERAQKNAPTQVVFDRMTFVGNGGNLLYFDDGVTQSTVKNSRFLGHGIMALYLDAESAENKVLDNTFNVAPQREVLAVDGSARNVISGNVFAKAPLGGIFLYRNCGEASVIRHQTPNHNRISGNTFVLSPKTAEPAIWVGSREGNRNYCDADSGYPYGSSANNGDFAYGNLVEGNAFEGGSVALSLRVREPAKNTIRDNGERTVAGSK